MRVGQIRPADSIVEVTSLALHEIEIEAIAVAVRGFGA
jgi:hypothetical protein